MTTFHLALLILVLVAVLFVGSKILGKIIRIGLAIIILALTALYFYIQFAAS